ncbi:MAG: polysaccharide deacetylase family protein [Desulfobacterales bacterium]
MMKAFIKFGAKHRPFSAGERIGCWSFLMAILLAFVDIRLSLMVLAGFVVMCFAAPFFPGSNFYLPVVSRGSSGRKAVALTFDDGPDPQTTPELLRLLKKHRVSGHFFVKCRMSGLYPHLIEEILNHGHCVANHSFNHDVFMAFRGKQTVMRDIEAVQEVLRRHGIAPLAFRPPVGITSPRLREVLQTMGMFAVNFSCRARDGGNRWLRHLSQKILRRLRPDDIVLLHDIAPRSAALLSLWVEEIDRILEGIHTKGLDVLPLAELIGRPVMIKTAEGDDYDGVSLSFREKPFDNGSNESPGDMVSPQRTDLQ